MHRNKVALALVAIFVLGLAYIVYAGRPVRNLEIASQAVSGQENAAPSPVNSPMAFSLSDVENHAVVSDCWSAVGGSIYDLTSWVSRHPGGSQAIESMCGRDSTLDFDNQHGGSQKAKAALVLLKIGELK